MYNDMELLKKEKEFLLAMRIEVKYQVDDGYYVVFVKTADDVAYSTEIYPESTDIRNVLCKEMSDISIRLDKVKQAIQTIKEVRERTGDIYF